MIFIGIDPGLSGAIATWRPLTDELSVIDAPVLNAAGKNRLDGYAIAHAFDALGEAPKLVLIEQVAARPGAGVSGMFNFGRAAGVVEGLAVAQFWPVELTPPVVWKRAMQCPKNKDAARGRASQLMPRHAHNWPLKKHDGRAEAALIALYAERVFRNREVRV